MKVKSESEVAQSCPTLSDPMDCSLPGFSAHGIFQARVLEWGQSFSVVNKTKVVVFLEFSCFFYDPANVGNLMSGFSAFFKSSWSIWKNDVKTIQKHWITSVVYQYIEQVKED